MFNKIVLKMTCVQEEAWILNALVSRYSGEGRRARQAAVPREGRLRKQLRVPGSQDLLGMGTRRSPGAAVRIEADAARL